MLARVPDRIPPTLPIGSSEVSTTTAPLPPPQIPPLKPHERLIQKRPQMAELRERMRVRREKAGVQASTTTAPLPPPQTPPLEPHERLIQKRGELAALRERSRVRHEMHENERIRRFRDPRLSQGHTEETGEGSTTTTPVPDFLDAPADTEKTGEGSTRTTQVPMDAVAPLVDATVPTPHTSDSGQQLGRSGDNLTELEVALANPNLRPEDRQYAQSAKFKNAKKMVPGNATTAR